MAITIYRRDGSAKRTVEGVDTLRAAVLFVLREARKSDERANLTDANLTDANLTDANLTDADLTRANLTRANLTRANLTRANLTDANLTRANLTRANLTDANLTDADLTDADLTRISDARADFLAIISSLAPEVPGLRARIVAGTIDGTVYGGACSCLLGSLAAARAERTGVECSYAGLGLTPDSSRPAEKWFLRIRPGGTPEINVYAALAIEWIDAWTCAQTIEGFRMRRSADGED